MPPLDLHGKKLLLIAPPFFGYYQDIITEIASRGGLVDWIPDRPFDAPVAKSIDRFVPQLFIPFVDSLYERQLAIFSAPLYDFVLVVNGHTLSKSFLARLRSLFSSAVFVLYLWDSFVNRPGIKAKIVLFDSVLTFDPSDADEYGLKLRPLFYVESVSDGPDLPDRYRLSFIGTAHSDRYSVVHQLRNVLPSCHSVFWYLYLQARWVFYAYRFCKPSMRAARIDEFHFEPLAKREVQAVFSRSSSILDISHPRQTGLTMRTLEVLGAGKKLVTTNPGVRSYDFYSESNILIIDRNSPSVDPQFLESPFQRLPPQVIRKYSISGWLDDVLSLA